MREYFYPPTLLAVKPPIEEASKSEHQPSLSSPRSRRENSLQILLGEEEAIAF